MGMKVNVLGVQYKIKQLDESRDARLKGIDGYCDFSTKEIVIDTFVEDIDTLKDLIAYKDKVIRHELVHAFLYESGLDVNSWARNEEVVDWIAIQFPKLLKVFKEVEVI